MTDLLTLLARHPRTILTTNPTPIEPAVRLGSHLGLNLLIKRDDLTSIPFGGNKVRQLEFYFGAAQQKGADTVLITGAVQSNYGRTVAAIAARLGMEAHIQLEERVPAMDAQYYRSGNVLLEDLTGAIRHTYPRGDDEAGADASLYNLSSNLVNKGRRPYVIPLGPDNPPIGALGYVAAAAEIIEQISHLPMSIDAIVLPSGSAMTHSGLLVGLRAAGQSVPIYGVCVRRPASEQRERVLNTCRALTKLLGIDISIHGDDINVDDDALAPGYGRLNNKVFEAIRITASTEALYLDPVYTGRTMAGLIHLAKSNVLSSGSSVLFLHTGGTPALFAYGTELRSRLNEIQFDA